MKKTETMTRDEKSLLLYFETCAVDKSGRVDMEKMNDVDRANAERWDKLNFVEYGRIVFADIKADSSLTHYCRLSDEAFEAAAQLRAARAKRLWDKKLYTTTREKREHE
jgi:hypothetical protein